LDWKVRKSWIDAEYRNILELSGHRHQPKGALEESRRRVSRRHRPND
jgi:hypothetical protein